MSNKIFDLSVQCPSCSAALADSPECGACGFRFRGSSRPVPSAIRGITRARLPLKLNLVVDIDRTGSSVPFRSGIATLIGGLLRDVTARVAELAVTIATHGDLDDGQEMVLLADRQDADQATAAVTGIQFGGGGDPAETHLDAIEELLNRIPWTAGQAGARDALLMVVTAESKPARSGRSARAIGEDLRTRGILLFAVCELTPQLWELALGAAGVMIPISNSPTADEIRSVTAKLSASIQSTTAAGTTIPLSPAVI
jgi:hypothetical protein